MKARKLSPFLTAVIAVGAVILIAVFVIAVLLLVAPVSPTPTQANTMANTYNTVTTAACPVAIAVGVLAYFVARSKQGSQKD
jgi:cell shape-determining protein MreD